MLLTEAAFAYNRHDRLLEHINNQPGWSDVPILLLAEQGGDCTLAVSTMEMLGNVTVLEQPVRVTTLISSLRAALKAIRVSSVRRVVAKSVGRSPRGIKLGKSNRAIKPQDPDRAATPLGATTRACCILERSECRTRWP